MNLPAANDFAPPRLLRNGHLQSMLSSSPLRRRLNRHCAARLEQAAHEEILQLPGGVRLQAFFSEQSQRPVRRGQVLLLHGWEGSARSNYLLGSGARLLADGFDVVRLNFRDHGDTHHLNHGLFHSCRLQEVADATREVMSRPGPGLRALAGYSLGGNFALRLARIATEAGLPLDYVVAVCPVIDPAHGLAQLEQAPRIYHAYFMRKWRESLRRKQKAFPDAHRLDGTMRHANMRELTRLLVERHTDFGSLEAYLDGYSIAGQRLLDTRLPMSILAARDDPVIPVSDFLELCLPPQAELDIAEFGGHCGFFRSLMGAGSFAEDYLSTRMIAHSDRAFAAAA